MAEVHIVLGQAKDALTIPSSALGRANGDNRYSVRVVEPGGAIKTKEIEIGLNNKVNVEVRSGLEEGDRVITGELSVSANSVSNNRGGPPPMGF